jgi:glycosyltransferase involved in cell wall biosynthesis
MAITRKRVVLFSTLYPSASRPGHGVFVETRLRALLGSGQIDARVVAPVPWFPSTHPRWGAYARLAATPRREVHHGIEVVHPRYALPPKVGMLLAPLLLALAARGALSRLRREGFDFDLIDAHYYYPDGVAAALLARWFARPLVITARGSDVNQIGALALPRRMMRWASRVAVRSVCVSAALAERLRTLGVAGESIVVLRNGVDAERFVPVERAHARRQLGLAFEPLLLSVGNLLEVKRHDLVIRSLARLRQQHARAGLAIVGDGPLRAALGEAAREAGVADAVHFAGQVDQAELCNWYSAADLLILASSREGWPNVLLESMACGTPVLASAVGGVPEIVDNDSVGSVVPIARADDVADAALSRLQKRADRDAIRRHALARSWDETSRGQLQLFAAAIDEHAHAHAAGARVARP